MRVRYIAREIDGERASESEIERYIERDIDIERDIEIERETGRDI